MIRARTAAMTANAMAHFLASFAFLQQPMPPPFGPVAESEPSAESLVLSSKARSVLSLGAAAAPGAAAVRALAFLPVSSLAAGAAPAAAGFRRNKDMSRDIFRGKEFRKVSCNLKKFQQIEFILLKSVLISQQMNFFWGLVKECIALSFRPKQE
jgi:hypothetical protein